MKLSISNKQEVNTSCLSVCRKAKSEDMNSIFMMGFDVWSDGMNEKKYLEICHQSKKYQRGQWWVLETGDTLVCSLITYDLGENRCGIGSIATLNSQRCQGHASFLLAKVVADLCNGFQTIFLYADISPTFYRQRGFKELPELFQKYKETRCMYYEKLGNDFLHHHFSPPPYF